MSTLNGLPLHDHLARVHGGCVDGRGVDGEEEGKSTIGSLSSSFTSAKRGCHQPEEKARTSTVLVQEVH